MIMDKVIKVLATLGLAMGAGLLVAGDAPLIMLLIISVAIGLVWVR
jgi:hypothetical protein